MKILVQLALGATMLASPSVARPQTGDTGARPAASELRFGLSRLRCAIFKQRRLTVRLGEKRELNFPTAISGLSKNYAVVRASVGFGTLTLEGMALGKTQIVVLDNRQEKQVIQVQVVARVASLVQEEERKEEERPEKARQEGNKAAPTKAPVAADRQAPAVAASNVPAGPVSPTNPPPPATSTRPSVSIGVIPADVVQPHSVQPDVAQPDVVQPDVVQPGHGPETPPSLPAGSSSVELPEHGPDASPTLIAPAGDTVRVVELTAVAVPVDQVSAAYSLDPLVAEAQIDGDHVRIWGRTPGRGVIVLVHNDLSTSTLNVEVMQAPPILPDRAYGGLNTANGNGYYESRVSSNPLQIGQIFDYRAGRTQLHLANAIVPGRNLPGASTTWFPFSFFSYDADRWKLTLLDERVNSSPISVNSTVLRGIHFAAGGLSVHAGYTSVAGFQSLFLPVHKQLIAGATFAHPVGEDSQVGVTGYYIERDAFALDPYAATGVATLFFRKHSLHGLSFAAEVGLSKGIGGALSAERITPTDQFRLAARYRPRGYAAPDIDNLAGLQSDARWNHKWAPRFASDFFGSASHLFTRNGAQTTEVGSGNFRYRPAREIVLSAGFSASNFSTRPALFPDLQRFSVPLSISYDRPRFGVGAQYEYSQTSRAFAPGQGYRGSVRWSAAHFQMNANAGLDTQALAIDSVFSAFPNLNAELAILGFGTITSVDQLAALLNDRALLNSLGIAPEATLQLVPRNWHAGLNLSWRSSRQALEFDCNYNQNRFLTQENTTALQTLRYRRGLTSSTEMVGSFTMFETFSPSHHVTPIWEIGLLHRFGGSPFSAFRHQDGTIAGDVHLQDSSGTTLVRGAEIMLDGARKTTSDAAGHYQFSRVPPGVHSVQIAFKSARPFYYTTPSKVSAMRDSVVNFGVIYPAAQVVGYALSDAGVGLPGIGILVKGPQGDQILTTDKAGQFFVPVPQPGDYVVTVNAETVPDGYVLEDLAPAGISVGQGEFKKISFKLPAIRALRGVVQAYDPAKAAYLPLHGVTVVLAELNRSTTTDERGWYSFLNMPSGTFTIQINQHPFTRISFGLGPQLLRQDIRLNPETATVTRQ